MTHSLKILPEYYDAVHTGLKQFEIRFNDRDFHVGDFIILREWNGEKYTGRAIRCLVTYIENDKRYCLPGYVVLSIVLVPSLI